jgi:hypothetical protein
MISEAFENSPLMTSSISNLFTLIYQQANLFHEFSTQLPTSHSSMSACLHCLHRESLSKCQSAHISQRQCFSCHYRINSVLIFRCARDEGKFRAAVARLLVLVCDVCAACDMRESERARERAKLDKSCCCCCYCERISNRQPSSCRDKKRERARENCRFALVSHSLDLLINADVRIREILVRMRIEMS